MMKYSSFLFSLVWWLKKAVLNGISHKAETAKRKDDPNDHLTHENKKTAPKCGSCNVGYQLKI